MVYSPPPMSLPISTQGVPVMPVWLGVRTTAFSVIIMPLTMMASAAVDSVMVGSLFDPLLFPVVSTGSPVSAPLMEMAKPTRSSQVPEQMN